MSCRSIALFLLLWSVPGLSHAHAQSADVLVIRTTQLGFAGPVGREIRIGRDGRYRIVGIKSNESGSGRLARGTVEGLLRTLDEQHLDSLPPRFLAWTQANPAMAHITAGGETRYIADSPETDFTRADADALRDGPPMRRRFRVLVATLLRQLKDGGLREAS